MLNTPPTERKLYDRFDLLLIVSAVTVTLLLLVDLDQRPGISHVLVIIVTLLTASTLLIAVLASGISKRGLIFALVASASLIATSTIVAFTPQTEATYGGGLWLLLVVAAPVVAVLRLNRHPAVTFKTILGAISVYLLIAIAAVYFFLAIDYWLGGAGGFFGRPESTTSFMYFSLVTITTLGYGDLLPVAPLARAAAVGEAVIGQVFLVIVVARLVSMYSMSFSPWPKRGEDSDD